ncbi:hypothetical protein [Streptomyces sp. NPDC056660]|uniref:hypothetical protein n=1 Tax=Streptomyces sp. NPDC056660 TaxID=3345897 RepID=UPI0036B9A698
MREHSDDRAVSDWCMEHLHHPVAQPAFTAGTLSVVHGLRLTNGREVVLKIRDDDARLGACTWVQRQMWQAGFPCPEPLTGSLPLDRKDAAPRLPAER